MLKSQLEQSLRPFTNMSRLQEKAETISLGSKITVGRDHSHEIKRHWLPGSKAIKNLDSILKK